MRIIIGEGENQKVVETKYNIGDIVTVFDSLTSRIPERTKYRPKWRDINCEEMDKMQMQAYPIEVDTRYTISDIIVSAGTGHYSYKLYYHNDRVIFPSASRNAEEDEIIKKVDTDDYECTDDVLHYLHYDSMNLPL